MIFHNLRGASAASLTLLCELWAVLTLTAVCTGYKSDPGLLRLFITASEFVNLKIIEPHSIIGPVNLDNSIQSVSHSSNPFSMQSSSVLIVQPSDYRFPMAGSGKFGSRHYSLDSPGSLTSPPGYDLPLIDQKPSLSASTLGLTMPNTCSPSMTMSNGSHHHFSHINPQLVYSPSSHGGLLPLSKY